MPIFQQAPDRVIQRLDGIGGVNHIADFRRIDKKRRESIPLLAPSAVDGRICCIPCLVKDGDISLCCRGSDLRDCPHGRGQLQDPGPDDGRRVVATVNADAGLAALGGRGR